MQVNTNVDHKLKNVALIMEFCSQDLLYESLLPMGPFQLVLKMIVTCIISMARTTLNSMKKTKNFVQDSSHP